MLKHQTQPTHDSCMVTCLAMVADLPVDDLWHHHENLSGNRYKLDKVMQELGIPYNERYSTHQTLYEGGLYVLAVPSLNLPGHFHQIVVQVTLEETIVLDPGKGRRERYYYIPPDALPENQWEVPLVSWVVDYEVFPTWLKSN